MQNRKRITILDIPVDMVNMDQANRVFEQLMQTPECSLIVTPNSEIIVNATKDSELKQIIESADLIIPDGIGLVYASRIVNCPLEERVTGFDFLTEILNYLDHNNGSIFLLGSKPETEESPEVAEYAGFQMTKKFPSLRIAGTHHGYFKPEEEDALVEQINASGADVLCVAMGAPKQEKFIANHRENLNVKAAIGVGGSLDVWAGTVKLAPDFYRNHGLEWLYRLVKQPSRYKRMLALPVFMMRVLTEERKRK